MQKAGVIAAYIAGVDPAMVDHVISVFVETEMESERAEQIGAAKGLFAVLPGVQQ